MITFDAMQETISFPSGNVNFIYNTSIEDLLKNYDKNNLVIITNEHIARIYDHLFTGLHIIIVPIGEHAKDMHTLGMLTKELLQIGTARNTFLLGIGGGVITDITGFLASIFMRGVKFGFAPTSLLGMVDAAIGGKNGINVGLAKNILGTINQPDFILFDTHFLKTLPAIEWSNGFAEIIKYACIFDAKMYEELCCNTISTYKDDDNLLFDLIKRCVAWKTKIVCEDEQEKGNRKLLNFGHTAAHAIEHLYELPHGKAVAIGMVIACMISENSCGLSPLVSKRIKQLLQQYHLPVRIEINTGKAMEILKMDKKRNNTDIDYVLLKDIGNAQIIPMHFNEIEKALNQYASNH